MVKKIDLFLTRLAANTSFVGSIWIFLLMFLICGDVLGRALFNKPIIGTTEIVQNSIAAIVFLMLPWATHLGQHVRSTMIISRLPEKVALYFEIFAFLIGAVLFLGIMVSSWEPMLTATKIRDFQGEVVRVPLYPVWWLVVYGSALSFYHCISRIIKVIKQIVNMKIVAKEVNK